MEKNTDAYLAYGLVFKKIRQSKSFTLDEAAGNATTSSHLSDFEHGKTMLGTQIFFTVLKNINVTQYEFENQYNNYLYKKDTLLYSRAVSEAFTQGNIVKLKSILEKVEDSLKTQKNQKKYKLDKIQVQAAINQLDPSFNVPPTDVAYLKWYLGDLKAWGQYEIFLLGHCAALISPTELTSLVDKMIDPANSDFDLHYIKYAIIRTLLNVIDILAKKHHYEPANKYIQYLKQSKIHDYHTCEKLTLIYNEAQLKYIMGNKKALDTMRECQKTFAFCDCHDMANTIEHELSELTKKYGEG